MKTTTFKCDRCGKSETLKSGEKSTLELCTVGIAIYDASRYYDFSSTFIVADLKNKAEWCKDCCISVGIRRPYPGDVTSTPDPAPTIEQQLVEVLRCFVAENTPQQNE